MDVMMCCKSVGTDLSMLDIDDFMTEISQLKKEVALLETKLRLRGDEGLKREDVVCCESSTQDSELSQTLLCYTESKPIDTQDTTVCDSNQGLQDDESTDQTSTESLDSVCNAGEQQQILQTKLKMCSVKLIDFRNIMMKIKTEPTEIKTEPTEIEPTEDKYEDNHDDGHDFILSDVKSELCYDGEITSSTSKERQTAQTLSSITGGETLSSKRHLERHERKQKLFTRSEISFTTLQEKKLHSEEHREKKQFHCEQCGKDFFTTTNINVHMRKHSQGKSFHCTECGKYFTPKHSLTDDKRIHTGKKPYKCSLCEKTFTQSGYLKIHQKVHTGEKPRDCNVCGKSFNRCRDLVSHQRTHTGEKPYKCSHCEKTFAYSNSFKAHQRLHTGEKPYICSICGERFTFLKSFYRHQKKHTEEQTTLNNLYILKATT